MTKDGKISLLFQATRQKWARAAMKAKQKCILTGQNNPRLESKPHWAVQYKQTKGGKLLASLVTMILLVIFESARGQKRE